MKYYAPLVALFAFSLLAHDAAAGELLLTVPGQPSLTSRAVKSGNRLLVTNRQGDTYSYRYASRLNSADGRFRGFYCQELQKAVRIPVSGRGRVYKYSQGRWVPAQMVARPLRRPANVRPVYQTPVYQPPVYQPPVYPTYRTADRYDFPRGGFPAVRKSAATLPPRFRGQLTYRPSTNSQPAVRVHFGLR